jgi:uncharacterized protein (TIGR00251 family)
MERLSVKVTPNAKRSEVLGWQEQEGLQVLRIKLAAPPVDGKANKALIVFVAKALGVSKGEVSILSGERQRLKTLLVPEGSGHVLGGKRPG